MFGWFYIDWDFLLRLIPVLISIVIGTATVITLMMSIKSSKDAALKEQNSTARYQQSNRMLSEKLSAIAESLAEGTISSYREPLSASWLVERASPKSMNWHVENIGNCIAEDLTINVKDPDSLLLRSSIKHGDIKVGESALLSVIMHSGTEDKTIVLKWKENHGEDGYVEQEISKQLR